MTLVSVHLKNFRSYLDQEVTFHQHLNIILGRNGHGKSNFLKSFEFVFTNNYSNGSRKQFEMISHRGITLRHAKFVEVTFKIDTTNCPIQFEENMLTLGRKWTRDGKDYRRVNGKNVELEHFIGMVEMLGLSYEVPYNIVQQGMVLELALKNPGELYNVLEEAVGIRKFWQCESEAEKDLQYAEELKSQFGNTMEDIEKQLICLESKKAEYVDYEKEETIKKKLAFKDYSERLQKSAKHKEDVQLQLWGLHDNKDKIQAEKDDLKETLEVVMNATERLNTKLGAYQSVGQQEILDQKAEREEADREADHAERVKLQEMIDQLKEKRDVLNKQVLKRKQEQQKEMEVYNAQQKKLNYMYLERTIDNSENRAQCIKTSILTYDQDIQYIKQRITDYERMLKNHNQSLAPQDMFDEVEYEEAKEKKAKLEETIAQLESDHNKMRMEKVSHNKRLNLIGVEREERQAFLRKEEDKFFVSSYGHGWFNFRLVEELRKSEVKGFYGCILDHISINKETAFAFEIASKDDLFAFLVEDEDVAEIVINKNKQTKGGRINIYTMNFYRNEPEPKLLYPNQTHIHPLVKSGWLKYIRNNDYEIPADFEDSLSKIIFQVFGDYILTDTYQRALKISREYQLNCITKMGEVVKTGGIFSKVGVMNCHKYNRLTGFERLAHYRKELSNLESEKKYVNGAIDKLQNQESNMMRLLENTKRELSDVERRLYEMDQLFQQLKRFKYEQKVHMDSVQTMKNLLEQRMKSRDRVIEKKSERVVVRISEEEIERQQQIFFAQNKHLNKVTEAMFEKDIQYNLVKDRLESAEKQLQERQEQEKQRLKQKEAYHWYTTYRETAKGIQEQIDRRVKQIDNIHQKIYGLEDKLNENYKESLFVERKISMIEEEENELKQKMGVIDDELDRTEMTEEEYKFYDEMKQKPIRQVNYTKQDYVILSNITTMFEEASAYQTNDERLILFEKLMKTFFGESHTESKYQIKGAGQLFCKIFIEILTEMNPNFTAQIHIRKVFYNESDNLRNGFDIKLRVENEKQEEDGTIQRNIEQLSYGQKTLVAMAFYMTLQLCQPCLFYLFDEADAALDSANNIKLSEMLVKNSLNAQYMVVTFKPNLIARASNYCLMYQVVNRRKVSTMTPINTTQALERFDLYIKEMLEKKQKKKLRKQFMMKDQESSEDEDEDRFGFDYDAEDINDRGKIYLIKEEDLYKDKTDPEDEDEEEKKNGDYDDLNEEEDENEEDEEDEEEEESSEDISSEPSEGEKSDSDKDDNGGNDGFKTPQAKKRIRTGYT